MIYVAGQVLPFFWPMRTFVTRNPLHGFEDMRFEDALVEGRRLFGAETFLPRQHYHGLIAAGGLESGALDEAIQTALPDGAGLADIDLPRWAKTALKDIDRPLFAKGMACTGEQVHDALHGRPVRQAPALTANEARDRAFEAIPPDLPVEAAADALAGTDMARMLDEQVIRACLQFFDEGQSVWAMPDRERGFFAAWRGVAGGPARRFLAGLEAGLAPGGTLSPEMVIDHVLQALGIPENHWRNYVASALARLPGWAGFIRWRSSAKRYHWSRRHPGDLVDLLAVRLTLSWLMLEGESRRGKPVLRPAIDRMIAEDPFGTLVRLDYHAARVPAAHVRRAERLLAGGKSEQAADIVKDSIAARRLADARDCAAALKRLADRAGGRAALDALDANGVGRLVEALHDLETHEGMIWLRAMEQQEMNRLLDTIALAPPPAREKRPFVQAAFCIDVRSERFRRHLESFGDYETFGIAGFFGVPVSLLGLGKGSEKHLCPVILTPKNLVLEMTAGEWTDEAAFSVLDRALHELKESVISPFVTVEAIGLLFGFDMIGKTVAPRFYNSWRARLHADKPRTHLMLDKLSREQADSVVRAVQRAVIIEAVAHELELPPENIPDAIVRALREAALGHAEPPAGIAGQLGIDDARLARLIEQLQTAYRINPSFADLQMEQLGRVGFSIDQQVGFVQQALASIGLTENFSRFVLLVGHGSTSENNPYEAALDCGACGGNDGLTSARVLAAMANNPVVRRGLAKRGITIPDDARFVPAFHNTTTDEIRLHDLELLPATHLVYLDRLRTGLVSAARLCAQERQPALLFGENNHPDPGAAFGIAKRNAIDWSQVRPEWGLSRNAHFVIGRRWLTQHLSLDGRTFLHSYDWRLDPKLRILENILTGPLVVAQWISLEYYFSTVDNDRFGAGSKVYHNVAGQIGVMTGNLSDLRTGLPAQTVLAKGKPFHEPMRLVTLIEAPFQSARKAIEAVVAVKRLVNNGWIRVAVVDPETGRIHVFDENEWIDHPRDLSGKEERMAS